MTDAERREGFLAELKALEEKWKMGPLTATPLECTRMRAALQALSVSHCGAPECSCCAFMRREASSALRAPA